LLAAIFKGFKDCVRVRPPVLSGPEEKPNGGAIATREDKGHRTSGGTKGKARGREVVEHLSTLPGNLSGDTRDRLWSHFETFTNATMPSRTRGRPTKQETSSSDEETHHSSSSASRMQPQQQHESLRHSQQGEGRRDFQPPRSQVGPLSSMKASTTKMSSLSHELSGHTIRMGTDPDPEQRPSPMRTIQRPHENRQFGVEGLFSPPRSQHDQQVRENQNGTPILLRWMSSLVSRHRGCLVDID
jgi:hypothetical protein